VTVATVHAVRLIVAKSANWLGSVNIMKNIVLEK
jgi:hypothetical protein